MKPLFLFFLIPFLSLSQSDPINFDEINDPAVFIGKTDHGMSLFQKNNNGNTCYRLSFPVYLEDKDQGSNHIDFFASKEDLNSLFIFMSESVGLLEMTPHYELGGYRIEYFTASKEVNGVTKRIGPTRVTISKIADPSLEGQLGYFTITKSQVGLLFGKQKF
jgi:hypothetical protein